MQQRCKYQTQQGEQCQGENLGNGYCFWHDPIIDKSGMDLAERLEIYANNGGMTKGLQLKRVNLKGINLVNRDSREGFDLSESDLYRANLQGASLFQVTLCHGSLMKANLRESNLHCANLEDTNLLGIRLHDAKIDNLHIGETLLQEKQAFCHLAEHNKEAAQDNFEQCEEIYRNLRKCAEHQGLFPLAGRFIYKELTMRRQMLKRWSLKWCFSKVVDLLCGYGEKPENTVVFSLMLVLMCAVGYFLFGVNYDGQRIEFNPTQSLLTNTEMFFLSLYYSVVTFTTLGYGDITPIGITRVFAALEAFLGSFIIALFVVVFVKRMTR